MFSDREKGGWFLGLAALAAVFLGVQLRPAGHPASADAAKQRDDPRAPAAQPAPGPAAEGPLKPVWEFLGPAATPRPPKEPTWAKRFALELSSNGPVVSERPPRQEERERLYDWPSCAELTGCHFRFLIATVPDPAESGFPGMFDQVVESLQRAIEADNYVIDHKWLPWEKPAAPGRQVDSLDRQTHPGLILFREDLSPGEDPRKPKRGLSLLALLLVGETPTAGIHKHAFLNAVRVIRDCPGHKEEGNLVRVIGPYFSGSAVSLRLALHKTREDMPTDAGIPQPGIKVVCGGASGFSHKEFLKPFTEGGWTGNKDCNLALPGQQVDEKPFQTTILPSDLVLTWVCRYLGNPLDPVQGEPPAPIIVLYEANTSFGQGVAENVKCNCKTKEDPRKVPFFLLPFPLHISQLRSSYTKDQLAKLESQGLPRSGRNLPFPMEDGDGRPSGRETIRAQAPLLTAAIDDLILDNVVTTMAQKQVRHVCLVSTDPQDAIFLARVIRDRYPDVQLFAVGNDLLFTHDDFHYALHGMILGSTYPLHPSCQRWSDLSLQKQRSRILFAQESYQGYYNATLVHLAKDQKTRPEKDLINQLMDYGWEGENCDTTMPPLWISVVSGNGQLIPAAYIPPAQYSNGGAVEDDPLQYLFRRQRSTGANPTVDFGPFTFPNIWFVFFVAFLLAIGWGLRRAWIYLRDSRWGSDAAEHCYRFKQRVDFAVMCLAVILLYGSMAELAWTPLRAGLFVHDPFAALAVCLGILGSLAALIMGWLAVMAAHRLEIRGWDWRRRWYQYCEVIRCSAPMYGCPVWLGPVCRAGFWIVFSDLFMLGLVTLTMVCFLWRNAVAALHSPFGVREILYFERAVHLSNGVSPLLPRLFFCLALFVWGLYLVKKLHLANRFALRCPFPDNGSAAFAGLRDLDRDIRAELMPPSTLQRHFPQCMLMFLFLLICLAKLLHDGIPPVDGVGFGRLSLFGFFTGSFLLLFTLLQFHFAWRVLQKMLRFLALLPMQTAFERLSEKVVAIFGHYLFSLRPRHSHLAVGVQQFEQMRRMLPAFQAELQRAAEGERGVGQLDNATLRAAWEEFQDAFQGPQLELALTREFESELRPAIEEDLQPPDTAVQNWGGRTGAYIHQLAECCLRVVCHFWGAHAMDEAFGQARSAAGQTGPPSKTPAILSLPEGNPIREWAVAAEDFVAMEIVRYLSQFIVQLRNLLTCLTVGSMLLILAATVYPFFPQHLLLQFLTVLGGGIATLIIAFLIQLNRDELVSRITRSTPNRFTPDISFLHGTAAYVLPIVVGLMVQFPIITSTLRSLFDPLFHIIK
jgi:hypothetical protein